MPNDSDSNNIITFYHVVKQYNPATQKHALEGCDLEITKGEFFCLVGPSGCGKSTILKIIAGLEDVTAGKVAKPGDVSMVFQSGALFPWLTVQDNAEFGLRSLEGDKESIGQTATKYLKMTGLEGYENKYPRELSGGQRQRVGIARALAVNPQVLLLDEPFSALDPITTEELHRDLLDIWEKTKITILMVSHLLEEAVYLADRIGVMKNGKIISMEQINLKRPRSSEDKEFLLLVKDIRKKFFYNR